MAEHPVTAMRSPDAERGTANRDLPYERTARLPGAWWRLRVIGGAD